MKFDFLNQRKQIRNFRKRYDLPQELTGRKIYLRSIREIFDKKKIITEKKCEAGRKETNDLFLKYKIQEDVLNWVLGGKKNEP